jgi:hypothetical protein
MQTITGQHSDKIRKLRTTSGIDKIISISVEPDDGSLNLVLKTKGRYKLKIGYYYTLIDNPFKNPDQQRKMKLDKYIIDEKILEEKYDSLSIGIGSNWYSESDGFELDDNFFEENDGAHGYPEVIDIIELVQL